MHYEWVFTKYYKYFYKYNILIIIYINNIYLEIPSKKIRRNIYIYIYIYIYMFIYNIKLYEYIS